MKHIKMKQTENTTNKTTTHNKNNKHNIKHAQTQKKGKDKHIKKQNEKP